MNIRPGVIAFIFLTISLTALAQESPVRITLKPQGLVHGMLTVPVSTSPEVVRVQLLINGVPHSERTGRSMVFPVRVGEYLRRFRIRAVGFDATGRQVGIDEMTVNDPEPPFRIRIQIPPVLPESGFAEIGASVIAPPNLAVQRVDFFVGEERVGTDGEGPYSVVFDASRFDKPLYARAVAVARGGLEANDIAFWGSEDSHDYLEVNLHQISVSVMPPSRLKADDLALLDNGSPREIESLIPASDQPLNVILLIDSSESMLEELPVVKEAARQFARTMIRPQDRIAVVGFHQQLFWLTPFTSDVGRVDKSLDALKPRGQTHLYEAVIRMVYELQKMPGRRALVVLTDGVNQGSDFRLEHLIHYAKYAGVPIYPVIKNRTLSRMKKFGLLTGKTKRFAEIARDSGASYHLIERPSQLPAAYKAIAEELQSQYVVTFRSDSARQDLWHSIELRHANRDVTLRVPRGYFP